MISINALHKTFGKLQVLEDVSFTINKGGIYAILGPNGSGKSTLLKSILGQVIPTGGKIEIDHRSICKEHKYRQHLIYLPQTTQFPENLRVAELLTMVEDLRPEAVRKDELINYFGLETYLKHKLGDLSGGTRQKVNIVLAFMYDAPICILDEPTVGLDPVALIKLKELIEQERRRNKVILMTTHIMPLVEEMKAEIIFLLEGRVRFRGTLDMIQEETGEQSLERAIASMLMS
ncbi:MAG: ABC transporter ATP-binding protein [Cytophagales bacterium]|nr:ABC transporter ATP-binding protein [Cytophagales bacterium]